jgi:hypothetical protein
VRYQASVPFVFLPFNLFRPFVAIWCSLILSGSFHTDMSLRRHRAKRWLWFRIPEWATIWGFAAAMLAGVTLIYMKRHDTKSDWAEIHRSMTNVLAARESAKAQKSSAGAYGTVSPNPYVEGLREYDVAVTQLRGELKRVGTDPLAANSTSLFEANRQPVQWQSNNFQTQFDELEERAAERAH